MDLDQGFRLTGQCLREEWMRFCDGGIDQARETAARIAGARPIVLPGVGHEVPEPVGNEIAVQIRALVDTPSRAA
ncbi:hypothetical protein [Actinoallomurus iriomotensis]|uniref:hypothetical protein n=1 Tax=Actinoallomurus iriomotensis TaxID=478107 RepID=UPI002554C477|nr:hypothetical protein [Actinoallomurus iriomotensis]